MSEKRIRLTRAELYEKAWAAPMRTLAKEFGMSDVGLAKICRKHDIPVPTLGYWRRKETGHEDRRPQLRPSKNGVEILDIYVRERLKPDLAALATESAPTITIPEQISHPLATKTEKLLGRGKENDKRLIVSKNGTVSHLLVSREHMGRALRIVNALFQAIEERGYSASWVNNENGEGVTLGVDGETLKFCLSEIADAERHILTPAEQKRPWEAAKWDYQLTGRLQFRLENSPSFMGPIRTTWSDGKQQRLESCMGKIVVGLKVVAAAIKKDRQQTEERNQRWEEERKQEEVRRREAAEHKRRAEFVTELIHNWEQAKRVRMFVKEIEDRARELELSDQGKSDIQLVVDWTAEYAEFLDPLSDLPDSVDEFVHPEKKYSWLKS